LELQHRSRISLHAVHWHNLILHYLLSLYTFIRHIKLILRLEAYWIVKLCRWVSKTRPFELSCYFHFLLSWFLASSAVYMWPSLLSDFTQRWLVASYRRFRKPIRPIFKGPTVHSPYVFIVLPLIKQGASWHTSWNTHNPTAKPALHTDRGTESCRKRSAKQRFPLDRSQLLLNCRKYVINHDKKPTPSF